MHRRQRVPQFVCKSGEEFIFATILILQLLDEVQAFIRRRHILRDSFEKPDFILIESIASTAGEGKRPQQTSSGQQWITSVGANTETLNELDHRFVGILYAGPHD